jgi:hypothetical protein
MHDDLVAELTLRIQAEGNAALDEVRSEFGLLDSTIQGLTGVLGELTATLAGLQAPVGLVDGMQSVVTETDEAVQAAQQLGVQLDANAEKMQVLQAASVPSFVPPEYVPPDSPAFIPPGTTPPPPQEPGPEPEPVPQPDDPRQPSGHGAADVGTHLLMAGVEASLARESAEKYAEFAGLLMQTAIKEGFSGDQAKDEVDRLTSMLDSLALKTGNSASNLAEAYYYLVIHGMDRNVIEQSMPALAQDATAYNNEPIEDAQAVSALNQVLNISPDQISRALSIISGASSLGGFSVGDFGNSLQGFAAQLSLMKDGGIGGLVQVAAEVEATHKDYSDSAEDAIDTNDLLSYLASPIAARFFDRTKRSMDLLAPSARALFDKYHISGINIPQYLDSREATGEGSFDAMMDLAHLVESKLPADISGTDEREIFGALFHNQQAAHAAMAIAENFDVFKADEAKLYDIPSTRVQTDFQSALNAPQGQVNIVNEQFSQMNRELGQDVIPALVNLGSAADIALKGLNLIGDSYSNYVAAPLGSAIGTLAAYTAHEMHEYPNGAQRSRFGYNVPMELHVIVSPSGHVDVTPKNVPPGTNVRVNQGNVLNTP